MADNTTAREVEQWLNDMVDDDIAESIDIATTIGEEALTIARAEHIYTTRSGNLQSSCGFAVTVNGEVVTRSQFKAEPGNINPDGKTGADNGSAFLDQCLQSSTKQGVELTMVAGMNYASYVEDWGGDVLNSAEQHIINEFNKWANEK